MRSSPPTGSTAHRRAYATARTAGTAKVSFRRWLEVLARVEGQFHPSSPLVHSTVGAARYLCGVNSHCKGMPKRLALTRDHEPWPGGESRKRDLNHRLAAGPQASPGPSSSLCFNPAGSAARQDTNAAQGRTRTRLLRRLHEYGGL